MNDKIDKKTEETAHAFLINAKLSSSQIIALDQLGYFTAPASMRHHLNCPGGLAAHSVNVTRLLLSFGAFKLRESAYRVGMLHDLVKCVCYRTKKGGNGYAWRQPTYPGHGTCSAFLCDEIGISLTPAERTAIIFHMGTFGLDENQLKEYQAATARFPEAVILTHAADHLASVRETQLFTGENEEGENDDVHE